MATNQHSRALVNNPNGKPITDADVDLVVKITKADIQGAKSMDPTNCAIARGCKRQQKELVRATINKAVAYLEFKDQIVRYLLPQSAIRELISLDRGGIFAEGEYRLKRPAATQKLGRPGIRQSKNDGSRGKRVSPRHVTVMVRGA